MTKTVVTLLKDILTILVLCKIKIFMFSKIFYEYLDSDN